MYYLIKPDITVYWTDLPEGIVSRYARDNPDINIDFAKLAWKPAERRFDAGLLNTALRFGVAASTGLVVGAQALVPLDYYRQVLDIVQKETARDSTDVPHADLFEALMPGWTHRTKELDDSVLDSTRRTLERAEREMHEAFSQPMNIALVEHWENLGGAIPPQPPRQ